MVPFLNKKNKHKMALKTWEMAVARAAEATPPLNTPMNNKSNKTFKTEEKIR